MATKPAPTPTPQMCLVSLANMSWGTKLLMSPSMLTRFAELMSLCTVVDVEYIPDGVHIVKERGDVDYSVQSTTQAYVLVPGKEADEFMAHYKATFELTPVDERPKSGVPLMTWEEYEAQKTQGEQA